MPVSDMGFGRALLDRVDLKVRPGQYRLAVQAQRRNTNRLQSYLQELPLPDYSGSNLGLSDLFLAREVSAATKASDPKFVRAGWSILPTPSHVFHLGQRVFIYFEIYNLARDEFGATRYEVAYEVHRTDETGTSFLPILARIWRRTGEAVTVRYEQTGTEEWVADYVELELGEASEGRHRVRMTVVDRNGGQEVSKEAMFWARERPE